MQTQTTADALRHFVSSPPYGAIGLHLRDAVWRAPVGARLANGIADEVMDTILGVEDGAPDGPDPRHLVVTWHAGNGDQLARYESPRGDDGIDLVRVVLVDARRLGVPVGLSRQSVGLGTEVTHTGVLFQPRALPDIGKLGAEVRLLDTADRFDVAITRIDRPGLVGRKVLRREAKPVTFQLTMDRERIAISYDTRKDPLSIELINHELIAIVHAGLRPVAVTTSEAHRLPDLAEWSPIDFRGRQLTTWIYERVMQRLGI